MATTKNIPAIRFNGFTDPWEQRKLGEVVASFDYGLNAAATAFDGNRKYLRITDIDDNSHQFLEDDLSSPDIPESIDAHYLLRQGEIVFARTGASVGKTFINRGNSDEIYFAGFLIRAKLTGSVVPEFVFQNTLTNEYQKFVLITSQRSGQPGINAQEYANFVFSIPSLGEQRQIGTFFQQLDNLITLHQRKLESLKTVKQTMLEKMFPRDGVRVPELRFPGFTGSWEQRKLGEVSAVITGATPSTSKADYWEPKEVPWLSSGEVNKKRIKFTDEKISQLGFESTSTHWIPRKSVLIALAGQGKTRGTVAVNDIPLCTNQSIAAITTNDEIDCEFLFQNLGSRYKELRLMSSGAGSRGGLSKGIIEEVLIPKTSMREQCQIGSFFQQLDNLITLHQRKYESLKTIKQTMLQKMFV